MAKAKRAKAAKPKRAKDGRKTGKRYTDKDKARVAAYFKKGLTVAKIKAKTGIGRKSIRRWLGIAGATKRKAKRKLKKLA